MLNTNIKLARRFKPFDALVLIIAAVGMKQFVASRQQLFSLILLQLLAKKTNSFV